jgi:hypothetical protein
MCVLSIRLAEEKLHGQQENPDNDFGVNDCHNFLFALFPPHERKERICLFACFSAAGAPAERKIKNFFNGR